MKPIKTFDPGDFFQDLGDEWKGTFQICQLSARELEAALEEAQKNNCPSQAYFIVCKSVLHNGQALDPDSEIPCKLFEILSAFSLPFNLINKHEGDGFIQELTEKNFTDSKNNVTLEQIKPAFAEFKNKLVTKFSEIKKVELFGGIVNRKQTDHDIDVFIELEPTTQRFSEIAAEIYQLSSLFPLPLETHIKIGSQTFIQREREVLLFGFG
jgi:predicted nucleotidyltransferase